VISELGTMGWLALVVAFGAIVPIIPTGAAVSGAAALAFHDHPLLILLVIAAGAAGAYAGDLVMYAMCRAGGEQLARRLRWLRDGGHVLPAPRPKFGHGAELALAGAPLLLGAFHPSQLNTRTGRLTAPMFDAVVRRALRELE